MGGKPSAVIQGIEAITVHVTDIQRARKFYSEVLGLHEVSFTEAASRAAFAIPGTSVLLTMHPMGEGEGGREPGTVTGVVFRHDHPEEAAAEIQKRGGKIVDGPESFTNALGKVTLCVFADPDGNQYVLRSLQK